MLVAMAIFFAVSHLRCETNMLIGEMIEVAGLPELDVAERAC